MTYSESYFTQRETWRDWRIEAHELMHLARVARDTRVLEIGCGGGGLLRLLHARGAHVVGVDPLDVALNLARERLKIDAATRRPRDQEKRSLSLCPPVSLSRLGKDNLLPFRANAFDAVIGQHVVEHLSDVNTALCEWKRVLKPNGRLTLATPNACYPDAAHFADEDHVRVFSPAELCSTVTHAGFAVEDCFTIFPFLSGVRMLRALGVIAYRVFRRAPYFAARGRTIMLAARK